MHSTGLMQTVHLEDAEKQSIQEILGWFTTEDFAELPESMSADKEELHDFKDHLCQEQEKQDSKHLDREYVDATVVGKWLRRQEKIIPGTVAELEKLLKQYAAERKLQETAAQHVDEELGLPESNVGEASQEGIKTEEGCREHVANGKKRDNCIDCVKGVEPSSEEANREQAKRCHSRTYTLIKYVHPTYGKDNIIASKADCESHNMSKSNLRDCIACVDDKLEEMSSESRKARCQAHKFHENELDEETTGNAGGSTGGPYSTPAVNSGPKFTYVVHQLRYSDGRPVPPSEQPDAIRGVGPCPSRCGGNLVPVCQELFTCCNQNPSNAEIADLVSRLALGPNQPTTDSIPEAVWNAAKEAAKKAPCTGDKPFVSEENVEDDTGKHHIESEVAQNASEEYETQHQVDVKKEEMEEIAKKNEEMAKVREEEMLRVFNLITEKYEAFFQIRFRWQSADKQRVSFEATFGCRPRD
jgi:hypothetical protein